MNDLIKRIDESLSKPSELHSAHETALYVLADCRSEIQRLEAMREYLPVSVAEQQDLITEYLSTPEADMTLEDMTLFSVVEAVVIERAGLRVKDKP